MARQPIPLRWKLARLEADGLPGPWIPSTVPGAVQLDWAAANALPDYSHGDNVRFWQGLEDYSWLYRAELDATPTLVSGERLFLIVEGVDYACDVLLGGRRLLQHTGMQIPIRLDVTDSWKDGAELDILIHLAPKAADMPAGRAQARESCKPAVSYGWDFHPRLIPLGLWQNAFLEVRSAVHFHEAPEVKYSLSEDCTLACGELRVMLNSPATANMTLTWRLRKSDGEVVISQDMAVEPGMSRLSVPFRLEQPALWWPHDQGLPSRYISEVSLLDEAVAEVDGHSARIGFRRVRLCMAPGQWEEPHLFPKSRSRPPLTFEINGRRIFAKGSNWVCPHIFPGAVGRVEYESQLRLAHESHFNILRLWGGSVAPQDCFYDLCDELGIMVWQDFPLSCNAYPDTEPYLTLLDQESRSLIKRLKRHPAVVLWCGGNELFNAWSGMTDQAFALRLLNRNTFELDPATPFLPTAPVEGMGHGHYVFRDMEAGEEAWGIFQKSSCSAYSEFGCPGPASVETLKRILPASELWPPRSGTSWETHHAFAAWLPDSWLHLAACNHYFGPSETLEELVERGQFLQAAGFQGLFEEARRQKPVSSMALNWCFNEPWPCAANNSLISWPCEPKPALAAVGLACRPTLLSARIRKLAWKAGENFDPEIWILHDGPNGIGAFEVAVWLEHDGVRIPLVRWTAGPIDANCNLQGPRVQCRLPKMSDPRFRLLLEAEGHPEFGSCYILLKENEPVPKIAKDSPARAMNF
ncbi:MAG: hypothetical protein BGO12_08520 [Verrucomicrobia bacterium 61-8]|nr:hypothetical protein [Verrucomicrobiota bacterium]OJV11855.1 MAG: hypothetical protein BGO12_08520 [Verrucomicrobia bacterium 61-8]